MANKDYDDLLRSFMNNSSKAYDEDRHAVEKQAQQAEAGDDPAFDNFVSTGRSKLDEIDALLRGEGS